MSLDTAMAANDSSESRRQQRQQQQSPESALEKSTGVMSATATDSVSSSGSGAPNMSMSKGAAAAAAANSADAAAEQQPQEAERIWARSRLRGQSYLSRTVVLRIVLILSLAAAVAVCATLSYTILTSTEIEVGRQTYESIAASALAGAQSITLRKVQGSEVMATLVSHIVPDAENWPMIAIEGYIPIAAKVAQLSSSGTQSLMVFLDPAQASVFERHTELEYQVQGRPAEAGVSDFGFGIWRDDEASPNEDGRIHDVNGTNDWGGPHNILVPLMLHNQPAASSLMYNVYSEADRGIHIDSMIECVKESEAKNATATPSCAVITDMLELKVSPVALKNSSVRLLRAP